ncbi:hypothetical protein NX868_29715 [Burkholderia thailandensis]|uniref:hypothetical protein n=2 Tax=Burkholderia thailandensis TaxID=57975 RepID=UPI00037554DD|nr:hypothetical protein [Burkholderia thailandensis]MCS3395317.1 hypothetical protein [Burkholderia thailandensis]MCS6428928.1 hypothetical protein [Burkholderia thailandensis]MCS6456712.1 hypothetical protein [Burkholderia thailandensis]MCS6468003.1 hypothetical protein [Burkholderia thailandensis]MCS6486447.1 hypothetical protein [Burkholderia thailandensis]
MDQPTNAEKTKIFYDTLGTLLEHAIRDQKLTGEAIEEMKRVSKALEKQARELAANVVETVKTDVSSTMKTACADLVKQVTDANIKATEAADAFQRARKSATFFVFLPAVLATLAAMGTWYGITAYKVRQLEEEKASLQQTVDTLNSQGGHLDVGTCQLKNGKTPVCIRVEDDVYGKGYHIPLWVK